MSTRLITSLKLLLSAYFAFSFLHLQTVPSRLEADDFQRISQLSEPPKLTVSIVRNVRTLVEKSHVLGPVFNDEVSSRGFETFLLRIDPTKSYFFAEDILEFQPYKIKLDDLIREDSIAFAYVAYKRFLQRLEQVTPILHQQIDAQHDFNLDESIPVFTKRISYAKDLPEITDRWRKTIKLNFLRLRSDGKNDQEIRETLHRQYRKYYLDASQLNADELLEMYLSSLTNAIDPHTNYKAPLTQERFANELNLEMSGIGATLKQVDGMTIVDSLVPGGAAELDGRIKSGDQIFAVAQEDGSLPVEIQELKIDDVVRLIRGKTGTLVRLYVRANPNAEEAMYEITRGLIKLEDAAAKSEIVVAEKKPDGSSYRFGIIKLNSFYIDSEGALNKKVDYRSATRDLKAILNRFSESKIDVVILDLSKNDRGSLSEAISVTGLFIDHGPVVQMKSASGKLESLDDQERGVAWDGPLLVMVSQVSTSASEVFAGAIQDYARGLLVGDPKTHGKGTVQRIVDIVPERSGLEPATPYGALKLTINKFYRPDGRSTQLAGVASDIVLPSLTAKLAISESDLEFSLRSDAVTSTQHEKYQMVDNAIQLQLQQAVDERVAMDPDFVRQQIEIDAFVRQKDDETISLTESTYLARRSYLTSERIRGKYLELKPEPDQVFHANFYNREIVHVARDYVDLLSGRVEQDRKRRSDKDLP